MKIEAVDLRRISIPMIAPFRVSFGVEHHRDILLVRVIGSDAEGWGECVAMSRPLYSAEYVDGAEDVIRRHLLPRLFEAGRRRRRPGRGDPPPDPRSSDGEGGARDGRPRRRAARGRRLAGRIPGSSPHRGRLRSLGRHPRGSGELVEVVGGYLAEGYRRIKLKIEPGHDVEAVARRSRALPEDPLAGRRQHRLHACRRRAAGGARPVRPASDRAAAG